MNTRYLTTAIIFFLVFAVAQGSSAQAPVREAGNVNQRLDRIEQTLQNQGLLEMMQQLQNIEQEVKNLRGDIEVQNHTIEQLQQRQHALYTDIDKRLQALENSGAGGGGAVNLSMPDTVLDTEAGSPPLQTLTPVEDPIEPVTTGTSAAPLNLSITQPASPREPAPTAALTPMPSATTALDPGMAQNSEIDPVMVRMEYDRAFSLLKQSRYEQAIKAFREFLSIYPVSEYSDNAQYWLGEIFYVQRQFEPAIGEYNLLVKNYPESQKYTHALLKIGYSYHELGQLEQARAVLMDLQRRYPRTTASRLAEERLKRIESALQQQAGNLQNQQIQPAN